MSLLADAAASVLPPEHGGPEPEHLASATRRLITGMPLAHRIGIAALLVTLHALALLRYGRRLGVLRPSRRRAVLEAFAGAGPGSALRAAGLDGLKSALLMAYGARSYGPEIAAVANRHEPSRSDSDLELTPAVEWPGLSSCDVVVIGSGAGGAFVARELARAGRDVIVVEEGERWDVGRIRAADPLDRFASLYRDAGATTALGSPPIALPLGRAVGGATVVNSGTCYRPPQKVADAWHRCEGLALAEPGALERRLTDVEETLRVGPVPSEVMGRNGELALEGAAKLGWESGPLGRNAPGCRGACQCALGCPNNAKAGVHLNALPQACQAGASVVSGLRVERILSEDGRARGIEATSLADGRRVRVSAGTVVVAAGSIETPPLLRRSGLGRHPRLGRNLTIHPAVGLSARFDEDVIPWRGVLQSAGVEELHASEDILIEATSAPPGMTSMTVPGYGEPLLRGLESAGRSASIGAMIADRPSGRVIGMRSPLVTYRLAGDDARRLVRALGAMARVMLATGAEQVEIGSGAPAVRGTQEIDAALEVIDPRRLHLAAFHPSGTAAAGSHSARHPVSPEGRLRGADGVWVADASILPTCPGVNPQVSIMALAAGVGEAAATS